MAEFKAEVVRLVNAGGKSIAQVAAELDLTETTVRTASSRRRHRIKRGRPTSTTCARGKDVSPPLELVVDVDVASPAAAVDVPAVVVPTPTAMGDG